MYGRLILHRRRIDHRQTCEIYFVRDSHVAWGLESEQIIGVCVRRIWEVFFRRSKGFIWGIGLHYEQWVCVGVLVRILALVAPWV